MKLSNIALLTGIFGMARIVTWDPAYQMSSISYDMNSENHLKRNKVSQKKRRLYARRLGK